MDDEELIRRWREGDEDAFKELRDRYRPSFLRGPFGWPDRMDRRLRSRHRRDFKGLFDDVLMKTVDPHGYDPAKGRYQPYLRRSLKNAVKSWFRRWNRHRKVGLATDLEAADEEGMVLDGLADPAGDEGDPAWLVARVEELRRVEDAIAHLPEIHRDALNRHFALEQECPQMAQELGITKSACRSRVGRALAALKNLLEGGSHRNEE